MAHLFRPDREIWDEKGGLIKKGPAYVGMILQPQIKWTIVDIIILFLQVLIDRLWNVLMCRPLHILPATVRKLFFRKSKCRKLTCDPGAAEIAERDQDHVPEVKAPKHPSPERLFTFDLGNHQLISCHVCNNWVIHWSRRKEVLDAFSAHFTLTLQVLTTLGWRSCFVQSRWMSLNVVEYMLSCQRHGPWWLHRSIIGP